MNLIKLDATDSTNDYLKRLQSENVVPNWTVVLADSQLSGKGQMGTRWVSENGKNLTMSILVKDLAISVQQIFNLNVIVAVAIVTVLKALEIPSLTIKWPNDIMSDNKKIGGILIENQIKASKQIVAIIGIGLNVNQTVFENLPNASSLALLTNKNFEISRLSELIFDSIYLNFQNIDALKIDELWATYNKLLFKKGLLTTFETSQGKIFTAVINEVNLNGKLVLQHTDQSTQIYEVKEIKMII